MNPDASGRLPNPMVGEIFGSSILEFGPEALGLHNSCIRGKKQKTLTAM
jgi:hypothetical protein